MTELQKQIWNYLQKHAVGYANAIHVYNLADELGIDPHGTNNDDLRAELRFMLIEEELPIGTCQAGVYIITTEDERERAIRWVDRDVISKVTALRNIELYQTDE